MVRGRNATIAVAVVLALMVVASARAVVAPPASQIPVRIDVDAMPGTSWELVEHRDFGSGGLHSMLPGVMRGAADDVHGEWVWHVDAELGQVREQLVAWLLDGEAPDPRDARGGQLRVDVGDGLEGRAWRGYLAVGDCCGSGLTGERRRAGQSNTVRVSFQPYGDMKNGVTRVLIRS